MYLRYYKNLTYNKDAHNPANGIDLACFYRYLVGFP